MINGLLAALEDRGTEGATTFAAWVPIDQGAPVPDLIGAIARAPAGRGAIEPEAIDLAAIRRFVAPRRDLAGAARGRRFVPDAPIAWP